MAAAQKSLSFQDFELDLHAGSLTQQGQEVRLRPKAWHLLAYLASQPGRVVPKTELRKQVWPEAHVSDATMAGLVKEVREILADDATDPKYIETVRGRGLRFVAKVTAVEPRRIDTPEVTIGAQMHETAGGPIEVVGRDREIDLIVNAFNSALSGSRKAVFVSGEPGIGKTALLNASVNALQAQYGTDRMWYLRGDCLQQFGRGEAYMPVLAAISAHSRQADSTEFIRTLAESAPTWLAQLPELDRPRDDGAATAPSEEISNERMLRELSIALERAAEIRPVVLVLDDLHWADLSTIDLVTALVRRTEPARIVTIATFRTADAMINSHPVVQAVREIRARSEGTLLELGLLTKADVRDFVALMFPGLVETDDLATILFELTEGNALFLHTIEDYLKKTGWIEKSDMTWHLSESLARITEEVPASLRQVIERQLNLVKPNDIRALECASVVGSEFSAAAVAAGLQRDPEEIESIFENLARNQHLIYLKDTQRWPDGTTSAGFAFEHAAYQTVLYQQIPEARKTRLHQRVAERLREAYGDRAHHYASELAKHYEQAGDYTQAAEFYEHAAINATQRSANETALDHLRNANRLLERADVDQRDPTLELRIAAQLLFKSMTVHGRDPKVIADVLKRTENLIAMSEALGDEVKMFAYLAVSLCSLYLGNVEKAYGYSEACRQIADQTDDKELIVAGHGLSATMQLLNGKLVGSQQLFDETLKLVSPDRQAALVFIRGLDHGTAMVGVSSVVYWLLGRPDSAVERSRSALDHADRLSHPGSKAFALMCACIVHQMRREWATANAYADDLVALAEEQGFRSWLATGLVHKQLCTVENEAERGSVLVSDQGSFADYQSGVSVFAPYFCARLALAQARAGQTGGALEMIETALGQIAGGVSVFESEVRRIFGEVLYLRSREARSEQETQSDHLHAQARKALDTAVEIAEAHHSKSCALRAITSRACVVAQEDDARRVAEKLDAVIRSFDEGLETSDMKEAREMLRTLNR